MNPNFSAGKLGRLFTRFIVTGKGLTCHFSGFHWSFWVWNQSPRTPRNNGNNGNWNEFNPSYTHFANLLVVSKLREWLHSDIHQVSFFVASFFRFKFDPTCGRSAVFNGLEPPPRGFSRWKLRTMVIMMTQMTRCGICYGAHGRWEILSHHLMGSSTLDVFYGI